MGYELQVLEKHLKGEKIADGDLPLYNDNITHNIKKDNSNDNQASNVAVKSDLVRSDEVLDIEENDKSLLIV